MIAQPWQVICQHSSSSQYPKFVYWNRFKSNRSMTLQILCVKGTRMWTLVQKDNLTDFFQSETYQVTMKCFANQPLIVLWVETVSDTFVLGRSSHSWKCKSHITMTTGNWCTCRLLLNKAHLSTRVCRGEAKTASSVGKFCRACKARS